MRNAWFRMYSEFATDPKVQTMEEALQRRLVMIFCLKNSGDLEALSDEELAYTLHITTDELRRTKLTFIKKGFIDEDWGLVHWDKRQYVSDASNDRVKRYRDKLKQDCNVTETLHDRYNAVTVTPPDSRIQIADSREQNTDTETETDIPPSDFSEDAPLDIPERLKEELLSRYSQQERVEINECIRCLATTRKSGKIADTVIQAELKRWATLKKDRVMHGVRKYVSGEHYLQNRQENYLWGIMKNASPKEIQGGVPCVSRDSPTQLFGRAGQAAMAAIQAAEDMGYVSKT